jgi:hypothetical protein
MLTLALFDLLYILTSMLLFGLPSLYPRLVRRRQKKDKDAVFYATKDGIFFTLLCQTNPALIFF